MEGGCLEGYDDVQAMRRLGMVELWSRSFILPQLLVSRLAYTDLHQPRINIFDTSHYWSLEPCRRTHLHCAWLVLLAYTALVLSFVSRRILLGLNYTRLTTVVRVLLLRQTRPSSCLIFLQSAVCHPCRTTSHLSYVSSYDLVLPDRANEEHRICRTRPAC